VVRPKAFRKAKGFARAQRCDYMDRIIPGKGRRKKKKPQEKTTGKFFFPSAFSAKSF
jgi:hypothetical protein